MTAPRPRRRPVAADDAIDQEKRQQLLTGFAVDGGYGRNPQGDLLDQMRQDWEANRDELLAEWVATNPGTRPLAWWEFDAPAGTRRETIDGSPHPFDRPERESLRQKWHSEHPHMNYDTGFLRLYRGTPAITVEHVRYESEIDYLQRLELLLPGELERVDPRLLKGV